MSEYQRVCEREKIAGPLYLIPEEDLQNTISFLSYWFINSDNLAVILSKRRRRLVLRLRGGCMIGERDSSTAVVLLLLLLLWCSPGFFQRHERFYILAALTAPDSPVRAFSVNMVRSVFFLNQTFIFYFPISIFGTSLIQAFTYRNYRSVSSHMRRSKQRSFRTKQIEAGRS